jgi:hypothetical protein
MLHVGMEARTVSDAARIAGLKRIVPIKIVKMVIRQSHRRTRQCGRLPATLVLWFVLALGLFCRDCYRQVFRCLQPFCKGGVPGRSTLCEARKSLGVRPLVLLVQQVITLVATPTTRSAFYRGMRLMALDGFVVDLPDTQENQQVFGRSPGSRGAAAFPQARLLALCEVGTHVIWRWLIKPVRFSEQSMCPPLLRHLQAGMLLLWDRNFLSWERFEQVVAAGAHLLARVQNGQVFKPLEHLADGSYLARLYKNGQRHTASDPSAVVRIIDYTFTDPNRPGCGQKHRLLTTLLDATLDPAATIIELYHERWEEELTIDELKNHQLERPVLRSQTPAGVIQELYALLLDHYILRVLMHEAAAQAHLPPRQLSFTATVKILRCRIAECPVEPRKQVRWWRDLLVEVAEERLPPRRNRINPRVIKRKMSRWKKKRPQHYLHPQPTLSFADSVRMLR